MAQATWKRDPRPPLAPKVLRLVREASLYLLVAVTVYLLVALWTYHTSDPGWSHSGAGGRVQNLGGRAGAWLADVLSVSITAAPVSAAETNALMDFTGSSRWYASSLP